MVVHSSTTEREEKLIKLWQENKVNSPPVPTVDYSHSSLPRMQASLSFLSMFDTKSGKKFYSSRFCGAVYCPTCYL